MKSWYNDFYYDLDHSDEMPVIEEGFVIAQRNDGQWNFVSLETGEPLDSKWYEDVHFLGKVALVQREDGISYSLKTDGTFVSEEGTKEA